MKLIGYLPDFYAASPQIAALQGALEQQTEALWTAENGLIDQLDVNKATWGLSCWEASLGLDVDVSRPDAYRRTRILSKLRGQGATTVAMLTGPVQAAEAPSPQELAAARLQSEGLMKGDENGELHLEDDLTRAELACLISPIILNPEHVAWETEWYTRMCTTNFNDVPEWAQVAVGVCASMGTMAGYGDGLFGPSDPVSPQMACTVMLRYLEQDGWTYDTACEKAAELGLAPAGSLEGDAITRGDMAILLTGSLDYLAYLQTL